MRSFFLLGGFAALFIVLGLGYSTLTPIFENSDETLHYPYLSHLAAGQGLPLALPNQLWGQEGTQPPLYYAIVAATTFWIDDGNLLDFLQPNPHWRFTDVRALINDNQNVVLHGPMDSFPYQRAALAIHFGRWWSLFFGLVTVICTFFIGRHFFPHHLPLVATATALTALTPQFLRVSATVSNDSLSAALAALTVLVALSLTRRYLSLAMVNEQLTMNNELSSTPPSLQSFNLPIFHPSTLLFLRLHSKQAFHPFGFAQGKPSNPPILRPSIPPILQSSHLPLLLGLLSGLALLTKLSSLTTGVLAGAIIMWLFVSYRQPFRTALIWLLIIGAMMALLSGWWFWRNYQLYGEWLAIETHLNLAGRGNLGLRDIWQLRHEIERAYWGTFGWGQIRLPEWVYVTFGWFVRLGFIGLLAGGVVRLWAGQPRSIDPSGASVHLTQPANRGSAPAEFSTLIFLVFWTGLSLALYARWVMVVGSVSHTRLIFPAITAISLLLAWGWHTWWPRPWGWVLSSLVAFSLLAVNGYSLGWLIGPAFRPNQQPLDRATAMDLTFLDNLRLVSSEIETRPAPANMVAATSGSLPSAQMGDLVTIGVEWQARRPLAKNYSLAALLLAPDGQVLARRETFPGLGLRPTRYLAPGETFTDIYPLELTRDVPTPLVARAVINLFDLSSPEQAGFPAVDPQGKEVTPLAGQIKIVPREWPVYQPAQTTQINFSNAIALVGYDLAVPAASPEKPLAVTLYWRSLAPVTEDYNLFIHLLDREGNQLNQADGPPTGNTYPTRWWAPGEIIADTHHLPAEPDLAHLRLGFYSLTTGQRLPVIESSLPTTDHGIEINVAMKNEK
jgi:hypothetical protein